MEEEWKVIPEFPKYSVSNLGRVFSRNINKPEGRILTPTPNKKRGYYYIAVQSSGKGNRKNYILHRLVARLFIPKIQGKEYINHINGDKQNNRVDNLEWCTTSENHKHAFHLGLRIPTRGELCGNSKLTKDQVLEIRKMKKEQKITNKEIAKIYGVGMSTITHIILGSRWNWLLTNE